MLANLSRRIRRVNEVVLRLLSLPPPTEEAFNDHNGLSGPHANFLGRAKMACLHRGKEIPSVFFGELREVSPGHLALFGPQPDYDGARIPCESACLGGGMSSAHLQTYLDDCLTDENKTNHRRRV